MKITVLGELHPEIGLAFALIQTPKIQALRKILQGNKTAQAVLLKRITQTQSVIRAFQKETENSVKAMQKANPDLYLVEGVEKQYIGRLMRLPYLAMTKRDASIAKETDALAKAYVAYAKLYTENYETFEYRLPRKILSAIAWAPMKAMRLAEILTGIELLDVKIIEATEKYTSPKYKIREIPAILNIIGKIRAKKKNRILVITGTEHAKFYKTILDIAGYETQDATMLTREESRELIKAMNRTDSLFEEKAIAADLRKAGIPAKEAGMLARDFRYNEKKEQTCLDY